MCFGSVVLLYDGLVVMFELFDLFLCGLYECSLWVVRFDELFL